MQNHDYTLDLSDKFLALIRFVFRNHAEFRHDCLRWLALASSLRAHGGSGSSRIISFSDTSKPLNLSSPIVLAAGANKNGKSVAAYSNFGFGGITIGTATRHFRKGNPHRPRVGLDEFNRLIYNSMGLNNDGIEKISSRVSSQIERASKRGMAVGISVAETPGIAEGERLQDLLETFEIAYKTADYIEVNVSCPNTGDERLDLDTAFMKSAFEAFGKFRTAATLPRKAIYAKLSPDLTEKQLFTLLDLLGNLGANGVILGNTYPSECLFYDLPILNAWGTSGGISGRPLYQNTFRKTILAKKHCPNLSVVACGGIDHGLKVRDLLNEGADFVQVYSVLAFRWMAVEKMNAEFCS